MRNLLATLLLLACSGVHAAEWELVAAPSNIEGGYLQVDRASILRKGQTVRVWTRAVYYKDFPIAGSVGLRSRIVASLTEYDCSERTETTRRVLFMSDDEAPLTLAERGPYEVTDVVPGSPKEKVLALVCLPPSR